MQRRLTRVPTDRPNAVALRAMSKAARDAARTWTMQQWAGRLAARAGPRDYMGQLHELYRGILERWRYVMENGERVPGSASAVLGHVLGADYNTCASCPGPCECDIEGTPWESRGWGDCDDVATLVAAGALSLGMTPAWRVIPGHVSVLVRTPRGEVVNVDPVGHPTHPFGWAAPSNHVRVVTLDGEGVSGMYPMHGIGNQEPHFAAIDTRDTRGPRVLALPGWAARHFAMGNVVPNTPAVDQYGNAWRYDVGADAWVPAGMVCPPLPLPMGRPRRRRKSRGARLRRRPRRRRIVRRIVRGAQRVGRAAANVGGKVARSPLLRELISQGGQAIGIPPQVTRGSLSAAGALNKRTGGRLAQIARRNPRAALKLAAQAAAEGAAATMSPAPFGAVEFDQDGHTWTGSPIVGFVGVDGVYAFGQLEVADSPTPGQWYRIKKGDTLLGITGRAYDLGAGGERLRRSKWINNVEANKVYHQPVSSDFYVKNYPDGIISFKPRWACEPEDAIDGVGGSCYALIYIPVAPGDEPPPAPEEPEEPIPELPSVIDEPVEPPPPAPLPPTVEPDEPEEPEGPPPPVMPPPIPPEAPPPPPPEPPIEPVPAPEEPEEPDMPDEPPPEPADVGPVAPEPADWTVPVCPPGQAYDYNLRQCVPVEPEPGDYTVPTCPPGYAYDYNVGSCVPVQAPTPPPGPAPPTPTYEPPQQPTGPAPGRPGPFPFLLAAFWLLT